MLKIPYVPQEKDQSQTYEAVTALLKFMTKFISQIDQTVAFRELLHCVKLQEVNFCHLVISACKVNTTFILCKR